MPDKSKILIADDNQQNCELLEAYLCDLDCEIIMAADGRETLAKAQKLAAAAGRIIPSPVVALQRLTQHSVKLLRWLRASFASRLAWDTATPRHASGPYIPPFRPKSWTTFLISSLNSF